MGLFAENYDELIGGVQAKGVHSHYQFELANLTGINRVFKADVKYAGECDTRACSGNTLGYCEFKDNGDILVNINCRLLEEGADDYEDFLLCLKAVDFHELAHSFFAVRWPVRDYKPREGYEKHEVFKALNLLMDQRDENFWLQAYPATESYFRFLALHPNLVRKGGDNNDPRFLATCLLLAWGRRFWLPTGYISRLREGFITTYGEEALQEVTQVIDEFLPTTTFNQQEDLVYRLIDIMRKYDIWSDEEYEPVTLEVDPELLENLLATGGVGHADERASLVIRARTEGGEGYDHGGHSDNNGEEEEGEGKGEGEGDPDQALEQERDALRQEANRTAQDIRAAARQAGVGRSSQLGSPYMPSQPALTLKRRLELILQRARMDMGSQYKYRLKQGVLDTNRARLAARTDDDRIFRKFIPSKLDKFAMATALLIDQSGSMETMGKYDVPNIAVATDLAWALAAALHNFNGDVEIIGFDYGSKVIKSFSQPTTEWLLKADGGTDPTEALIQVVDDIKPFLRRRLSCMCIIITDGEWFEPESSRERIQELNRLGVVTVEFLIDPQEQLDPHGCIHTFRVDHILECASYVEEIINTAQTSLRKRLQLGRL